MNGCLGNYVIGRAIDMALGYCVLSYVNPHVVCNEPVQHNRVESPVRAAREQQVHEVSRSPDLQLLKD